MPGSEAAAALAVDADELDAVAHGTHTAGHPGASSAEIGVFGVAWKYWNRVHREWHVPELLPQWRALLRRLQRGHIQEDHLSVVVHPDEELASVCQDRVGRPLF